MSTLFVSQIRASTLVGVLQASAYLMAPGSVSLEPGKDIAVVGFNDTPLAKELFVPLTSVRLPLAQMGLHAVELLHKRILGEPAESIILAPELQVRASSSRLRRTD